MTSRAAAALALALTLMSTLAVGQVRLQSRNIEVSAETTNEFLRALKDAPDDALHGLAKFSRIPGGAERKALAAAGIHVLAPFQGFTYRVRVEKRLDMRTLERVSPGMRLIPLTPPDRVAPALWREDYARYVLKRPGEKPSNYVLTPEGTVNLTVLMQRDVPDAVSTMVLGKHARTYTRRSNQAWLVTVTRASVRALASEDAVQWIGPAPLPFVAENDKTRTEINAELLQNFNAAGTTEDGRVQGLGGRGVQVALFDYGMDSSHGDLAGRVIRKDIANLGRHATHEAGTIAGSGVLSNGLDSWSRSNGSNPYQWRGVAPLAQLIDADHEKGGDSAVNRNYVVADGMDISNHSYAISLDGDYSSEDAIRDQLIRGDAISGSDQVPARLQVTSAANNGQSPDPELDGQQVGYFSLSKQAKNVLVVGNWDSVDHKIHTESSLGPAHDGRIKPDVVAPGRTVASSSSAPGGGIKSAGYCSATSFLPDCVNSAGVTQTRQNFYRLGKGTSMASAATTGAIALVLEQYAATYSVVLDQQPPLPSTLRGLMIHTARDKQTSTPWLPESADGELRPSAGPDFVTGWGLIDAEAAVEVVRNRHLHEDTVQTTCDVRNYLFTVPAGTTTPVRITLAWDDFEADPGNPPTEPTLVNDLDLELIDPSGARHLPWQLDQSFHGAFSKPLTDAQLTCGTEVKVRRQFMPVSNPVYLGPGDPGNVQETLPGSPGRAPAATRGRDHLNNVEVVEATAMPGIWIAKVRGFKVPKEPQRYSLIGASVAPLPIGAPSLCSRHPLLCSKIRVHMDICERFPQICDIRFSVPIPGTMRVQFATPDQKIVFPVDQLCRIAMQCPVCASDSRCTSYDLAMRSERIALRAAVYSSEGRLMASNVSASESKRLKFAARTGEQYFVVLEPGKGTRIKTDYDIQLLLN
jgi:hypothetical protein